MKKISIFVLVTVLNCNLVVADIDKGKWNFVNDPIYCYIGSAPINTEIEKGKKRGPTYILVYKINKNPTCLKYFTPPASQEKQYLKHFLCLSQAL